MTFGNGYAHFFSTQVKRAVLVALTGKMPNPPAGGISLVFNKTAEGKPLAEALPVPAKSRTEVTSRIFIR